jgi:hypothetical protein
VTKSKGKFKLPVFQGGGSGIEKREKRFLRQSGYGSNNMTIQENSQDWDCFSGIIAKMDLRSVGCSGLSLYTGGHTKNR